MDLAEGFCKLCDWVGGFHLPGDERIEHDASWLKDLCDEDDWDRCAYAIDVTRCKDYCDSCCFLGMKPPCQRACAKDAIFCDNNFGTPYCMIDPGLCVNCGKCADACVHTAIAHNGEHVGLTSRKALNILKSGLGKGIARGVLGSLRT